MTTPNTKGLPKRFPRRAPNGEYYVELRSWDCVINGVPTTGLEIFIHQKMSSVDIEIAEEISGWLQAAVAEARKRGLK